MLKYLEILTCRMENRGRVRLEQLPHRCRIYNERVDQGDLFAVVDLDQRNPRKIRTLTMELGVDGVTLQTNRSIDEGPELLIIDDQLITSIAHSVAPLIEGTQSWICTSRMVYLHASGYSPGVMTTDILGGVEVREGGQISEHDGNGVEAGRRTTK